MFVQNCWHSRPHRCHSRTESRFRLCLLRLGPLQSQWLTLRFTSRSHIPLSVSAPLFETFPINSMIPLGLISDIDDTIKYSNILSGARSVFFNVFVKDLTEALIPGMPEWYNEMWHRGVRFHYVVSDMSRGLGPILSLRSCSQMGRLKYSRSFWSSFKYPSCRLGRSGSDRMLDVPCSTECLRHPLLASVLAF
jgi:hypothetical protein